MTTTIAINIMVFNQEKMIKQPTSEATPWPTLHTFSTLFRTIQYSWGLRNFPAKNEAVVEGDLYKPCTTIRVDSTLVVVPYSERGMKRETTCDAQTQGANLIKLSVVA